MDNVNPITTEVVSRGKELLVPENAEATRERMGGSEVVDQIVLVMRNSVIMQNPTLALLGHPALQAIEVAIFTGMCLGVATEIRARESDELLRSMGVE